MEVAIPRVVMGCSVWVVESNGFMFKLEEKAVSSSTYLKGR